MSAPSRFFPPWSRGVRGRIGLWTLCLVGSVRVAAADRAPEWLGALRQTTATVARKEDVAAVLLEDTQLDVSPNGAFTTRLRFAVRVLTAEGSKQAVARAFYYSNSSKVKLLQAWLIAPDGKVTEFGKKRIADVAVHTNALELYGEARQQLIVATEEAKAGAIFGYEAVVEETSVVSQRALRFQAGLPAERINYTVQLPPGWRLEAHAFNQAPAVVTDSANRRYTWTATAIPALGPAPWAPPAPSFIPWVGVDLLPPAGARTSRMGFSGWKEIATYFSPRYEDAAKPDAALKAKADELVRGKTELFAKLQALGGYAQDVTYISIQLDAANAGGYTPRTATRVFRTNYGDCKDKATLLRALLASQGIVSFPLFVQAGAAVHLQQDWPSPFQFNHAILAIQVDESVDSPAVFTHPQLGRLLIFDPTNESTPIGSLADTLLADQGVLLAGERGGLIALPLQLPESNRMVRHVRATLDDIGGIQGTIEEEFFGQASADARRERRRNGEVEFRRRIERWLAGTLPAARNTRVETHDFWTDNRFTMTTDFASANYGKLMRDELLIFKPVLVARRGAQAVKKTAAPRTQPVLLRPSRYKETTEITLPTNCTVEESLRPVALTTAFGSYQAACRVQDGKFIFERSLDLQGAELPASEYEAVRAFFDKILQTEQTPIVLRRARPARAAAQ